MRPSEVVWAADDEPGVPVLLGHGLTVDEAAARVRAGEDWRFVLRELLDALRLAADPGALWRQEPRPTGDARVDAYLAAVVEHQAATSGADAPLWVLDDARFLASWWWPSDNAAFTAACLVQSPAAFRRRGIFIGATTLARA